jgi:heme/copper-type cytochrome/quinol oxidase subunit 1
MTDTNHPSNEHAESGRAYVLAWLALLVLTLVSFGAHFLELGAFATAVSLIIAGIKAGVVALARGPRAPQNPWSSRSYEWLSASPPPQHNFLEQPDFERSPYDYHLPDPTAPDAATAVARPAPSPGE